MGAPHLLLSFMCSSCRTLAPHSSLGEGETGPGEGAPFPFKAQFRSGMYLFCLRAIDQAILPTREFGRCVYFRRSNAQLKCGYLITQRRGGNGLARTTVIVCLPSPAESLGRDPGSVRHLEVCWGKHVYLECMPVYCSENELKDIQNCRVL